MSQLALLDEYLQNEFARPAHWVEPPSKVRGTRRAPVVDYSAWLEHAAGCEECGLASENLIALRSGQLEAEPAVPCSTGIRLLPLVDVKLAAGAIDRGEAHEMLRRIIDRSREVDGWGPEARMSAGQAWGRM